MYEEYLAHFSEEISDEIKNYATEEVLKFSRYIFTHKQGVQQYGYCTHCNNEFKTVGLKHNKQTECPVCKSTCTVKSSGRGRKYLVDRGYFVYYEKSLIDPNVVVARGIFAERSYRLDYKNVKTVCDATAWYVFEMGKSIMLTEGAYWKGEKYKKTSKVYSFFDHTSFASIHKEYSRKSIKKAVKDTPFQYSTWEKYNHEDMTEFFDLYSKAPCIEYLTKEGFSDIVCDKLEGYPTFRTINWRGKTIFKVLKISKQDLKELKCQSVQLTFSFLQVFQDVKKHKWNLDTKEIANVTRDYWNYYDSLLKVSKYSSMRKIINYLEKQYTYYNKVRNTRNYYDKGGVLINFRDYISDCVALGMDINNTRVLFPKNLYTAHQNTIKQIKIQQDRQYDILIKDRAKLLEKYIFNKNGLIIRPAESSKELIDEGAALHHCVGTYAKRYAKGDTNIFVIRKETEPDKPYFTMEVNKYNEIVQVRGKNNRSPEEEVNILVGTFKEEKLKKKKARAKVAISA